MNIREERKGSVLTLYLAGKMNSATAPELEKIIRQEAEQVSLLILDFRELDYISSAGLRVLIQAQQLIGAKGGLLVRNVNSIVMNIFQITGFSNILTIEPPVQG